MIIIKNEGFYMKIDMFKFFKKRMFLIIMFIFCSFGHTVFGAASSASSSSSSTLVALDEVRENLTHIGKTVEDFLNTVPPSKIAEELAVLFLSPLARRTDEIGRLAQNCGLLEDPIITFASADNMIFGSEVYAVPSDLQKKFVADFLTIASTANGQKLLKNILISILLKIPSKIHPALKINIYALAEDLQNLKHIVIYKGESKFFPKILGKRNVGVAYSGMPVNLPVINEDGSIVEEPCPSDVALLHEMVHWRDALTVTVEEIASIKIVTTRYNKERNATFETAKSFSANLIDFYFPTLEKDPALPGIIVNMWCAQAERDKFHTSRWAKLVIDVEEIRAIYGEIGRPSENSYRFEKGLKLRAYHSGIKATEMGFRFIDPGLRSRILASAEFLGVKGGIYSSWRK